MATLVIWVCLGIGCAAIASAKGRRTWLWAILGILGGVFSLLVIVCLPKLKQCPACSNEVKQEAMVCYHCGFNFIENKIPSHH
jgi:hypothetical protein